MARILFLLFKAKLQPATKAVGLSCNQQRHEHVKVGSSTLRQLGFVYCQGHERVREVHHNQLPCVAFASAWNSELVAIVPNHCHCVPWSWQHQFLRQHRFSIAARAPEVEDDSPLLAFGFLFDDQAQLADGAMSHLVDHCFLLQVHQKALGSIPIQFDAGVLQIFPR